MVDFDSPEATEEASPPRQAQAQAQEELIRSSSGHVVL